MVCLPPPPNDNDDSDGAMDDVLRCGCCWTKELKISNGLDDDVAAGAGATEDGGAAGGAGLVANGSKWWNGLLVVDMMCAGN